MIAALGIATLAGVVTVLWQQLRLVHARAEASRWHSASDTWERQARGLIEDVARVEAVVRQHREETVTLEAMANRCSDPADVVAQLRRMYADHRWPADAPGVLATPAAVGAAGRVGRGG